MRFRGFHCTVRVIVLLPLGLLAALAQEESFTSHFQQATKRFREDRFDDAKQSATSARQLATNADQRQRADKLLQSLETAIHRRRIAEQLANRVGIREEILPAAASEDHSSDVAVDAERLNHTLTVFTEDLGGKFAEGIMRELQCREGNSRMIVECDGKRMAFEIDNPGEILITRAAEHTATIDFRCGKQKAEKVRVGYQPALKDGRFGFLRILHFHK